MLGRKKLKWNTETTRSVEDELFEMTDESTATDTTYIDGSAADKNEKSNSSHFDMMDDELSTRLFTSVVGIVEERRHLAASLQEYIKQIDGLQRKIDELMEEKRMAQLRIEKREDEITRLQRQFTDQQFKYDQLVEEYKQLRSTDSAEREKLQQQIKELKFQYEKLHDDYNRFRSVSANEVARLEDEVRHSLLRYDHLQSEYNKVRSDNMNLVKSIKEFTNLMSAFENPTSANSAPAASVVPIRPSVSESHSNENS